jgi:hypothetical protein
MKRRIENYSVVDNAFKAFQELGGIWRDIYFAASAEYWTFN